MNYDKYQNNKMKEKRKMTKNVLKIKKKYQDRRKNLTDER